MKADVVIIGGGPAGLTAGIFASRAGQKVLCIEKLAFGGQASLSYEIANYPGLENISGADLANKMYTHAKNLGVNFENAQVIQLKQIKSGFSIKTKNATHNAKKVIIANGLKRRTLNLSGEGELTGKGISYCASCDGGFFKNKTVAVVGGGNTAMEDVAYLSHLAKKIYLINRSENFRANQFELNKIKANKKVEILENAVVTKLFGTEYLTGVEVSVLGKKQQLKIDGLFVAIGGVPDLDFVTFDIARDNFGYIKVDENMRTSVKNLYACGDVIHKNFRQVVTACAEGAIAGNACIEGK